MKKDNISVQREALRRQEERRREEQKRQWMEERSASCGQTSEPVSDVRIVLFGNSISGKSAAGNIILGREAFDEDLVLDQCKRQDGRVFGKTITVIDTPDILSYLFSAQSTYIERSISMASPGPHVFLLVISYTQMKFVTRRFIRYLMNKFGEEILKFITVILTHAGLSTAGLVEMSLRSDHTLQRFVSSCGGGYHIFNTEEREERTQVAELLRKIEAVLEKNGGQHYSDEMYKETQRTIKERMERKKEVREEVEKQTKELREQIERLLREERNRQGTENQQNDSSCNIL